MGDPLLRKNFISVEQRGAIRYVFYITIRIEIEVITILEKRFYTQLFHRAEASSNPQAFYIRSKSHASYNSSCNPFASERNILLPLSLAFKSPIRVTFLPDFFASHIIF